MTKGEIAVIYARGNHELKGKYAEEFHNFVGTYNDKFYYNVWLDNTYITVLDIGEDHDDDWWEYYDTAYYEEYRIDQYKMLEDTLTDARYLAYDYKMAVCHIPVVSSRVFQIFRVTLLIGQTDILSNRASKLVHAENTGVQQHHQRGRRHNPAEPLDGIPFKDNHQNNGRYSHRYECQQNTLPQAEFHRAAPASHKILNHPGYIGVNHIHQFAVGLGKFPECPGTGGKNGGNQITSPIFQRIHLLIKCNG